MLLIDVLAARHTRAEKVPIESHRRADSRTSDVSRWITWRSVWSVRRKYHHCRSALCRCFKIAWLQVFNFPCLQFLSRISCCLWKTLISNENQSFQRKIYIICIFAKLWYNVMVAEMLYVYMWLYSLYFSLQWKESVRDSCWTLASGCQWSRDVSQFQQKPADRIPHTVSICDCSYRRTVRVIKQ